MRSVSFFRWPRSVVTAIAGLLAFSIVWADDITDSNELLCYDWSAARCDAEDGCEVVEPYEINVPDFLKVDLDEGTAVTTGPESERRTTEIESVARPAGQIVLQGKQGARAFSWLITEATGEGTLTVSTASAGITIFTICTPMEEL